MARVDERAGRGQSCITRMHTIAFFVTRIFVPMCLTHVRFGYDTRKVTIGGLYGRNQN
jgi:hypothetical protein